MREVRTEEDGDKRDPISGRAAIEEALHDLWLTDQNETKDVVGKFAKNTIFTIPFNRLKKTDKNFWTRTARLMNSLNKHIPENELTKSRLTKMYHEFFDRSYNEMEPCTWRILPLCGSCNPAKTIVPAEN